MKMGEKTKKSDELNYFFNINNIEYTFNLTRLLWWGEKFKHMVNLVKNALYGTVGKATLSQRELK